MSAEQGLHDRISGSLEWRLEQHPIAYPEALDIMEHRVAAIAEGRAPELLWLLEHPCLYTAGTSAKPVDLIQTTEGLVRVLHYLDAHRGRI